MGTYVYRVLSKPIKGTKEVFASKYCYKPYGIASRHDAANSKMHRLTAAPAERAWAKRGNPEVFFTFGEPEDGAPVFKMTRCSGTFYDCSEKLFAPENMVGRVYATHIPGKFEFAPFVGV